MQISEEDAYYRAQLVYLLTRSKRSPGLTHKGCVLQRVSLGALNNLKVVRGMRQSIGKFNQTSLCLHLADTPVATYLYFVHYQNGGNYDAHIYPHAKVIPVRVSVDAQFARCW